MAVKSFITNGKRWRFLREKIKRTKEDRQDKEPIHGECDPPDTPDKAVRIDPNLKGEAELDTIIHEILHASAWSVLDDDFVWDTANAASRLLWRLGYRKVAEEQ